MKSEVSVVRCHDYGEGQVEDAVRRSLALIGGAGKLIKPGDRVLLKVNILAPAEAEQAVTTHPSLVRAMIKLVREAGGVPFVADSPGFLFAGGRNNAMKKSGIMKAAEELGAEVLQFETVPDSFVEVDVPGGAELKTIYAARLALEADVIISMPKLKTHGNTLFTGAVKNMFGAVPQKTRMLAHSLVTNEKFSSALVDIYSVFKPDLAVMDAVVGMEGDGPRHGQPRKIGLVLASFDPPALDAVASKIVGFEPGAILTTKFAHERGLGCGDPGCISVLGETIEDVAVPDFKKPASMRMFSSIMSLLAPLINGLVKVEPHLDKAKCTRCAVCAKSCPVHVITLDPYPIIDRSSCIKCYCCNELCPEGAMEIKRTRLAKALSA